MSKTNISQIMSIFVVLLISCGDNSKTVVSNDAISVKTIKNNTTETYNIINDGSTLVWRATHLGGVQERLGNISYQQATVLVNEGKITNASFAIDMNSLVVNNLSKDDNIALSNHLKDADFFNIKKHPTSNFDLTQITPIQGAYNSKVTGNLTILGLSKSITFNAIIVLNKTTISINSENFSINREGWGLTYHAEGSEGVPLDYLISNKIGFKINITLSN